MQSGPYPFRLNSWRFVKTSIASISFLFSLSLHLPVPYPIVVLLTLLLFDGFPFRTTVAFSFLLHSSTLDFPPLDLPDIGSYCVSKHFPPFFYSESLLLPLFPTLVITYVVLFPPDLRFFVHALVVLHFLSLHLIIFSQHFYQPHSLPFFAAFTPPLVFVTECPSSQVLFLSESISPPGNSLPRPYPTTSRPTPKVATNIA
jgi:hypothetical protein